MGGNTWIFVVLLIYINDCQCSLLKEKRVIYDM
jgi:hypothetical protein